MGNPYNMVPQQLNEMGRTFRGMVQDDNRYKLGQAEVGLRGEQQKAAVEQQKFKRFMSTPMTVDMAINNFPGLDDEQKAALKERPTIKFMIQRGDMLPPGKIYDAMQQTRTDKIEMFKNFTPESVEAYQQGTGPLVKIKKPEVYSSSEAGVKANIQGREDVANINANARTRSADSLTKYQMATLRKEAEKQYNTNFSDGAGGIYDGSPDRDAWINDYMSRVTGVKQKGGGAVDNDPAGIRDKIKSRGAGGNF